MGQTITKLLFLLAFTSITLEAAPKYLISQEDTEDFSIINLRDRLSFGLQMYSVVPNARPFQSVDGGTVTDYEYQISTAFGFEVFYKYSKRLDLGLSTAWEIYENGTVKTGPATAHLKKNEQGKVCHCEFLVFS